MIASILGEKGREWRKVLFKKSRNIEKKEHLKICFKMIFARMKNSV